jgi:hypothetical protein
MENSVQVCFGTPKFMSALRVFAHFRIIPAYQTRLLVSYARRGIYLKVTCEIPPPALAFFRPLTPIEQHADCLAGKYLLCAECGRPCRLQCFAPIIRGPMRDNGPFSCQQRGSMSLPIRFYDVFGCMHARPLGWRRTRAANYMGILA